MAETKITTWRSQRKEVISWVHQNEREHFQTLLLLGYSGLGLHQFTNDLERKGGLLIDGAGTVFQFFKTVSLCQAAWLLPYLDWPSAKWHWSTALSQPDFGRGGKWHSQAGVTGAQSWALSAGESMAQRASPPLFREFIHLLGNINCKSKAGGMGQAGNGGGSGLASDRIERLSQGPLSSAPDVCVCTDTKIKISMKLD